MTDEQAVLIYTLAKSIKDDHFTGRTLSGMYQKVAELEQEVRKMYEEMYRQANGKS